MISKNWSIDKTERCIRVRDHGRGFRFAFWPVRASILVKECAACDRYACNGVLPDRTRFAVVGMAPPHRTRGRILTGGKLE